MNGYTTYRVEKGCKQGYKKGVTCQPRTKSHFSSRELVHPAIARVSGKAVKINQELFGRKVCVFKVSTIFQKVSNFGRGAYHMGGIQRISR